MKATILISAIILTLAANVFSGELLYVRPGDPISWTTPGTPGNLSTEIQRWQDAGFIVDAYDLLTVDITAGFLGNYDILCLNTYGWTGASFTEQECLVIYDWVINGGRLMAGISMSSAVPVISRFGVEQIEGANGWPGGLPWYYHGAPWTFGPITGPIDTIMTMAAEAMDHPILSQGNGLTIDAIVDGYVAIAHGEFGLGKIVIAFPVGWDHDETSPGNVYRANIFQADNLQFLQNVII